MPVWHASVSYLGRPVESWGRRIRLMAQRRLDVMLRGVGGKVAANEVEVISIHLKKYATAAEAAMVGGVCDVRGTDYKPMVAGATF